MDIKNLTVNTLRVLSAEQVQQANSGHPGLPLGAAPMAYALWADQMNHNPKNPEWVNRDRFILSAGHGSALLYSLLHVFGYGLSMEELKNFRQMNSLTPGHPEYGHTVGVEATTGPLGQGLAMAVGMAMAEEHLAAQYNTAEHKIVDHYTYAIAGDGCMMEGITNEASSLAGHLGLSKLIVLYDSNDITIEGSTNLAFTESVADRYRALGWDVQLVEDGTSLDAINLAVEKAKESDRPSMIEIRTKIGFGSTKEGKASAHGEPLGIENMPSFKANLGWAYEESFTVPEEVKAHTERLLELQQQREDAWNALFEDYKQKNPELAEAFENAYTKEIDQSIFDEEYYGFEKDMATRESSGIVLNRLAEKLPQLFGGSADLSPSNKSDMKNRESFKRGAFGGSNVHFGVREHAMGAICNGLALHGGVIPYCATFLIFSDYMKPAIRLSSLMKQRVIYVFTHDSIGVGEDGPTHQPIEQMAMLRAIPGLVNFRPCDARETAAAWSFAISHTDGPTTLALTRQKLKNLEGTGRDALQGGYILKDYGDPSLILMASGSEVELITAAAEQLYARDIGVRVVSMPSWELFDQQPEEYKEAVLPKAMTKRIAVEAASPMGWHKYVPNGAIIGMEGFGASAPAGQLFEHFGITAEAVIKCAEKLIQID